VTRAARLVRAAPYAALVALAGWLYALAGRIEFIGPEGSLGPGFWPQAILALLGLVCAWEIANSLLFSGRGSADGMLQSLMEEAGDAFDEAPAGRPSAGRLAAGMAATLAYVLLVDVLGFFAATAAYLCAFIAVGGYRRWGVTLAVAVLGSLALVFVFMKIVYVSLPLGEGPFRALSLELLGLLGVR